MRIIVLTSLMVLFCGTALADWPQFLGPDRNGISPDPAKLATTWPSEGPRVLWTAKIGPGFGGVAIVGQELFLLERDKNERDVLRCLDFANGNELWTFAYDAPGKMARGIESHSTPAVDEQYVFTSGPFGDFYCIDRKTHQPVWKKNLLKDFSAAPPMWAMAQSPLLFKDLVIDVPCGTKAGIVAFKKGSGEIAWQSEACGDQQYMSAVPMTIEGVDQIVGYGTGPKRKLTVLSVDSSNGHTLWKFDGWYCPTPVASPLYAGGGKVFLSGGYDAGSVMFQVTMKDSQWSTQELWRLNAAECGSQICNPLLWNDHLFVDNNENGKNNGMVCVGMGGKVAWSSKTPNCSRGGQIIAGGMIFKVDGAKGMLYLIEPTAESFKVVAQAKLLKGGEIWAPLAISDGKLIIRDQSQMKCLDVKQD